VTQTFEAALGAAARALRDGGIDTSVLDARLLLCHAAGLTHEALIARGREALGPDAAARFEAYVARRRDGEPVSRIRGTREFYGRPFRINAHTLDPRPDTETLITAALELVARKGWHNRPLRLLDLGTGSGCILITLLAELPLAQGVGTDISEAALQLAGETARRLDVGDRARFVVADWLDGVPGPFDLIVSNPPYIPAAEIAGLAREVAAHDPHRALDGGADGLEAYRRIALGAPGALRPGGQLLVEIGASQSEAVSALFRASGFTVGEDGLRRDLGGRPRCIVAGRPSAGRTERRAPPKIRLENHDVQGRFVATE